MAFYFLHGNVCYGYGVMLVVYVTKTLMLKTENGIPLTL